MTRALLGLDRDELIPNSALSSARTATVFITMTATPEPRIIRFSLLDLAEQVEAFWQRHPDARAYEPEVGFVPQSRSSTLALPLAAPAAVLGEHIGDYVERLSPSEEVQVVLLLQAGAMAFGCWRGDELVQHKAVKKYVVRGNGRSQATHLKTRGKSRYGSRLRLQNWRRLLGETNQRLADCEAQFGSFSRVFYGVAVRTWSDLFEAAPPPPFLRDDRRLQRLPLHVHRPDHEELLRIRRQMLTGRVILPA
ncbi:MAG: hypothetical protein CMJ88_02610 [Planctomycetes bacterium]|nr:hypothetical protein [Planctomycetota bacterium]